MPQKRNNGRKGQTLVEMLDQLEAGKIGHQAAMDWLHIESLNELVYIVYANGRVMLGHQDMIIVMPETRALLRRITHPIGHKPRS